MIYLSSTQAANAAKAPEEASSHAQPVLLSGPDVEVWLPGWLKPYWDFLATYPVVLLPVLMLLAASRKAAAAKRTGTKRKSMLATDTPSRLSGQP